MRDAEALEWLDRLLSLDTDGRTAALQQLANEDPELHTRLVKLLSAALTVASSSVLDRAAIQGMAAVVNAAELPLQPNQSVAGYRLVRELGRGGMAAVWLAERSDGLIKRTVAMKLPLFSVGSPVAVARFLQEKDVLASLTHPHIARLYDAGVVDGRPFIVLEYIDGVPITEYCDRHALDLASRVRLFLQVLDAVEHAHKRLVVHRDLKPSNILVDCEGQVKLLDFGISKLLVDPVAGSRAVDLTQLGDAVLTPAYAAPEQANGGEISTLTDVFVLGVVLHQLLSGALPYAGVCGSTPTLASMIDALLRSNPTRPSQVRFDEATARCRGAASPIRLGAALKGDLDTITHKALQFEPSQRYGSAERFAHDLRCFLANRPIAARKPGRMYSLGLFLRRNRAVSVVAGVGAVLSLVGATAAVQQYFDARANAERAAAARDFMFEFVNDAEPSESQSAAEITGRQMLDAAVERSRRSLRDKPELQGEVLGELGRMYVRFFELDLAAQTMREGLRILEANVEPGEAALSNIRAQLSGVLLRQNQQQQAHTLAVRVLEDCQRGTGCARARYIANTALADIYRQEGRTDQSLQAMRNAVRDAAIGFGERHTDTTEALGRLAYMLRSAGYFIEAGETIDRAVRQSADQMLRKVERLRILRWKALIELDLGRYDAALERLNDLVPRAEGGSERALLLRTIANAHLAKGEPVAALDNVEAAIRLLEAKHSGADLLYTIQVRAQALALLNRGEEALDQIGHVIDQLVALGRLPQSPEVMRAQRIHGEILLRNGRPAEAARVLAGIRDQLLALNDERSLELAQTLDLLGCAQRELGLARQAVEAHEAADVLLKKILPADHPFLTRNTLYRVAAANDR